jgi:small subunit ribosomal protein S10e
MMIIPKANIKLIYQHLLAEGVLVVKKDARAPTHDTISVPNLHVMKALQSLRSRGVVTEEFNWQYHYYFLTDDGVKYLREYLHVGESVVPATHVNKPGSASGRREGERAERGERRERKEEGGEYRRGGEWRRRDAPQAATA